MKEIRNHPLYAMTTAEIKEWLDKKSETFSSVSNAIHIICVEAKKIEDMQEDYLLSGKNIKKFFNNVKKLVEDDDEKKHQDGR